MSENSNGKTIVTGTPAVIYVVELAERDCHEIVGVDNSKQKAINYANELANENKGSTYIVIECVIGIPAPGSAATYIHDALVLREEVVADDVFW